MQLVKWYQLRLSLEEPVKSHYHRGNRSRSRSLIVSQPTRGLDVGAIEYIHKRLIQERIMGKPFLVVSFELDEILNVSDRIAVIHDGRSKDHNPPETTNKQELGIPHGRRKVKEGASNE